MHTTPATGLTRKQRNRVAADRSRRKRQAEHNQLKERVRELEIVNSLLRRENERLASTVPKSKHGLLSTEDLRILRRLTEAAEASARNVTSKPTSSPSPSEVLGVEISSNCDESNRDKSNLEELVPNHESVTTSETAFDPATKSLRNIASGASSEEPDCFEPAVLEDPMQKEQALPSSLRRRILAAIMTPKIALALGKTPRTEQRLKSLLGSRISSTAPPLERCGQEINPLVSMMFSQKWDTLAA